MGIQGLIKFLRDEDNPAASPIQDSHLQSFKDTKVGVDVYTWLHKAVYSCADEIYLRGNTKGITDYCVKQIQLLLKYDIKPVLVFDGDRNPLKIVEETRRQNRDKAKSLADHYLASGNTSAAYKQMAQAIDITNDMAVKVMKDCRQLSVECIVAPYEADAQLAYLEKEGYVQAIITEDSDLIIYGCNKILFKLSNHGKVQIYSKDKMVTYLERKYHSTGDQLEDLRFAAIMSGCDYLQNIPNVGLKKAIKFIVNTQAKNPRLFLKQASWYFNLKTPIDDEYVNKYVMAYYAFIHPLVFDPIKKMRVPLKLGDENSEDYNKFMKLYNDSDGNHYQLALGNIDKYGKALGSYNPDKTIFPSVYNKESWNNLKIKKRSVKETNSTCNYAFEQMKKITKIKRRSGTDTRIYDSTDVMDVSEVIAQYKEQDSAAPPVEPPEEPPAKKLKSCKFAKKKKVVNDLADFQGECRSHFFNPTENQSETEVTLKDDWLTVRPFICETQYSSSSSRASAVNITEVPSSSAVKASTPKPTLKEIQNIAENGNKPPTVEDNETEVKLPSRSPSKSPIIGRQNRRQQPVQAKITRFFKMI